MKLAKLSLAAMVDAGLASSSFAADTLADAFKNGKVSEELIHELAALNPLRAVFRDNGFASDAVKVNVTQIFKQRSPITEVKAI